MGPDDYIETVLTCKGDYYDPEFPRQLERFSESLRQLIQTGDDQIYKCYLIYSIIMTWLK